MNTFNIVFLDGHAANPGDLPMDEFHTLGCVTFYRHTDSTDIVERARDADAILINKVCITDAIMAALPRLRYIGVQATGYNVVDTEAAHRRGITVTNVPTYSTMSVAQQVLAHLLNVCNNVGHYANAVRSGAWTDQSQFCFWDTPLVELAGKCMGIIGYGNIGRQVEKIASALGMNVKHASARKPEQMYAILPLCDVVSLHCPATSESTGMVDATFMARMKPGAILINTARGQLIDEYAVTEALHSGKLSAYCSDTMVQEPPLYDNELIREPNAYFTPHNAWATKEARTRLQQVVASNLRAFIEGKPVNTV